MGIDFKIVFIIYSLLLITLFFVKKYRSNILRYYYIFPVFFCDFTFFILVLFPEPHIDLFKIIINSNELLLSGKDPYQYIYPDIYNGEFDYAYQKQEIRLVYWPLSLYLTFPFQFLFGDFRYAYIFYILLSAFVVYFYFFNVCKFLNRKFSFKIIEYRTSLCINS